MVNSVTHSYEYSVLCDVCKFKFKASQLRLRWDGLQVCQWDWEQRHPADFYRGRNDAHKLPWTRPDDGADPTQHYVSTWTTIVNVAGPALPSGLGVNVTTPDGDFQDVSGIRTFVALIVVPFGAIAVASTPLHVTLPSNPVTAGTYTLVNDQLGVVDSGIISTSSGTILFPASVSGKQFFTTTRFSGQYGI